MIDLVHIYEFSDRLKAGWRMVPGYELTAGDTRVTMQSPDHDVPKPNTSVAAKSRRCRKADPVSLIGYAVKPSRAVEVA